MRRLCPSAMIAAAILGLASCAGGQTTGPLIYGHGSEREVCVNPAPGERYLVGDTMSAPDDADISIAGVHLVGATGLELEDAVFVPLIDRTGIGALAAPPDASEAWRDRVPAKDFAMESGAVSNLVVTIRRTGEGEGFAQGIAVDYRSEGVSYSKTGTLAIRAKSQCW